MGAWGHAPPGKFSNLGAMRLLLRLILGQYDTSRRPNDRVSHECHFAHWVYTKGASLLIQFAYRLKATPFAGEVCETNHLLVKMESCWKTRGTVLLHCMLTAISQVSRRYLCASGHCMGVRQAMVLIGNARQAMSEGNGPVETGLTGPAATALYRLSEYEVGLFYNNS